MTEIKSDKKSKNNIVSTLREDSTLQAFGLTFDIFLNLEEAFPFPITTVLLSMATSDRKLRQSGLGKASF